VEVGIAGQIDQPFLATSRLMWSASGEDGRN
jgi:hypothetical protein